MVSCGNLAFMMVSQKKLPESIESSHFVSCRARISVEFDSRKDSHSKKLEWRPQIFVRLSFWEFRGSKLPGLHLFDMAIIHWVKNRLKQKGRPWVCEIPIIDTLWFWYLQTGVKKGCIYSSSQYFSSPENSKIPRKIQEKCIFQQSADLNFKNFPFGDYHGVTPGATELSKIKSYIFFFYVITTKIS